MSKGVLIHTAIVSLILLAIVSIGLLPEFSESTPMHSTQLRVAANYASAYLPVTPNSRSKQLKTSYCSPSVARKIDSGFSQMQSAGMPISHMSSQSAQVHVIGTQPTSQSSQDYTTTRSTSSIAANGTWKGQISMVAAPVLAYVPAQSGELPAEMFAPAVRRAPPEEEGGGTNGPNLEQPMGDAIPFCLLLAIIFILIKRYNYRYEN